MAERIVILGKGGIGKSTIAANLSELYALEGKRVLHVGCDPKSDSALLLTGGEGIPTVVEALRGGSPALEDLIYRTGRGVDCLEAGGPAPGEGCAGMGLLKTFELLESGREKVAADYDAVVFDVLGDIVCGGFAVPLRKGFGRKVLIVVSEDLMSLYAANNIARAMTVHAGSGAGLMGLVANGADGGRGGAVDKFASLIKAGILARCPSDPAVREAEAAGAAVVRVAPRSPFAAAVRKIKAALDAGDPPRGLPRPVDGRILLPLLSGRGRKKPAAAAPPPAAPAACPAAGAGAGSFPVSSPARKLSPPDGGGWRRFFSEGVFAGTGLVRYTGRQAFLAHEDRECAYGQERLEESEKVPFLRGPASLLPGSELRREEGSSRSSSALGTREVIMGSGSRVAEIAAGLGRGGPDYIFMTNGCVPYAMGEDVQKLAAEAEKASGVPVVISSTCLDGCSVPGELMGFLRAYAKGGGRKPARLPAGAALLLGYGGSGLRELDGILAAAGVKARWMLPEYDGESLEALRSAGRALLSDSSIYDRLEAAFSGRWKKSFRRPPSPYGFPATAAWLLEAAALAGREKAAREAARKAMAARAGEWAALKARAAGKRIAFVAGEADLDRVFVPARSAGIPPAGFLAEAGFGLDLLVYAPEAKSLGRFRGRISALGIRTSAFSTEAELRRRLAAPGISAVWSDFNCDYRVSDAGKAQVSLDMFRPGFAGACRTLETILAVCGADFASYGRKKN
ncbi:MAG: hypothetical protein M0025_02085 [Elusimicrobia bacterium]|nr:hypothetical protein [Elusimicrobiota bacterium]